MKHFVNEVRRMRWPLLLSVGVLVLRSFQWLPWDSHITVAMHKLALACLGTVCAHIVVQQAFPYIDAGDLLRRALHLVPHEQIGQPDRSDVAAFLFSGVCLLRGAIYAAFILGVTLGM